MAVDAEQDSRARRDGIGDVADDLIGHGLSDLPVPAAPEHDNWTLSHVWPGTHTTAVPTAGAVIRRRAMPPSTPSSRSAQATPRPGAEPVASAGSVTIRPTSAWHRAAAARRTRSAGTRQIGTAACRGRV